MKNNFNLDLFLSMLHFFVSDLYNLWKSRVHVPAEDKDGRLRKGISDSIW